MLLATNEFRHCKWMCGRMSRTTHASTQLKALGLAAGHLYLKRALSLMCMIVSPEFMYTCSDFTLPGSFQWQMEHRNKIPRHSTLL